MKYLTIKAVALVVFVFLAVLAQAEVNPDISIQGVLTNNYGLPLPDDDYLVTFKFYDAQTGGNFIFSEHDEISQVNGVFNYTLYNLYPDMFDQNLYLELTIDGESPMVPRIRLTPVPVALRASTVDPTNAVTSLESLHGNIDLVAGNNVSITHSGSSITISADAGTSSGDSDWEIVGNDIYHTEGRVKVGLDSGAVALDLPQTRGGDLAKAVIDESKLAVEGVNEGIYTRMNDSDDTSDGHNALFALRHRMVKNDGTGFGAFETNTAITGYNDWGDSYTFGVAGYTWFDSNNTGAVLGSKNTGDYWGSLAFRDGSGSYWGMYTPNNLHVGGLCETTTLRLSNGATSGYILTSDASGNATWQAPSSATSDGDWTISGSDLFHPGYGTVSIGTSTPQPLMAGYGTTLQVNSYAMPTLCLDRTVGGFERWGIFNAGGGLRIGRTEVATTIPVSGMEVFDTKTEFRDQNGDVKIKMQTYDSMENGSVIYMYGTTTTSPTLTLDGQVASGGANIILRDGNANEEVVITGNHFGTGVGRVITPVLEITGGSDLSEQFDIGNTSALTKPGMVVSIDPNCPGQLTLSGKAYDRKVAGVISGAGGVNTGMLMGQSGSKADGEHPVALIGRVYVWADATSEPIVPGDLLTTSDRPGHAMKVTDHELATGAILGKAMTGLSEGTGLILTLVTLQ